MNRRVLMFVLLAVAVIGAGLFLTTRTPARPAASATGGSGPTRGPSAEPVRPANPAPEAKAPADTPRAAEPGRRATTQSPQAKRPAPAPAPRPADTAMLRIDADVPDAQVFVDRVFIGKAPVTTTEVKPGSHRLNVSAAGYEGLAENIDVRPGMQQVSVKLREVRLDAAIPVVHKHRVGSCTGRLVATPRGLRYDTTDAEDAFTAGLLDLETFEVDYLEKNLRVKPKQGKRFDFTDPDGNADRLFVFHRDVEKARERLKKGDPPAAE